MAVCSKAKCVALATNGALCAPHAAGYDRHDTCGELRCVNCRGLLRKDEWFQTRDGGVWHVKKCAAHPDVVKERAEKAAREAATA